MDLAVKLGREGIQYLLECNGGLRAYMQPKEMLDLCVKIVKVSADQRYRNTHK